MRLFRGVILSVLLSCGLITAAPVAAQVSAEATTTVTVNFPEILVLYTFSDITLTLDATFLAGEWDLGTVTACGTLGGCVDAGTKTEVGVDATTDLNIATSPGVPADGSLTDVVLTLQNALGARSVGLTDANYTLAVVDQNNSAALNLDSSQPVSFSNTGLQLSTSDIVLLIDPSQIVTQADSAQLVENYVITVSGT